MLAEQPDFPFAVAKRNQIFAEQSDPDRRAVGLSNLA
jgi:hypothetical protein